MFQFCDLIPGVITREQYILLHFVIINCTLLAVLVRRWKTILVSSDFIIKHTIFYKTGETSST